MARCDRGFKCLRTFGSSFGSKKLRPRSKNSVSPVAVVRAACARGLLCAHTCGACRRKCTGRTDTHAAAFPTGAQVMPSAIFIRLLPARARGAHMSSCSTCLGMTSRCDAAGASPHDFSCPAHAPSPCRAPHPLSAAPHVVRAHRVPPARRTGLTTLNGCSSRRAGASRAGASSAARLHATPASRAPRACSPARSAPLHCPTRTRARLERAPDSNARPTRTRARLERAPDSNARPLKRSCYTLASSIVGTILAATILAATTLVATILATILAACLYPPASHLHCTLFMRVSRADSAVGATRPPLNRWLNVEYDSNPTYGSRIRSCW